MDQGNRRKLQIEDQLLYRCRRKEGDSLCKFGGILVLILSVDIVRLSSPTGSRIEESSSVFYAVEVFRQIMLQGQERRYIAGEIGG